jgi:hypothetical protein
MRFSLRNASTMLIACFALWVPCARSQMSSSGTTNFIFEGNRIYAELTAIRPDGTPRKIRAFVDMGSLSMEVSDAVFKDLQLDRKGPLLFKIGGMSVRVACDKVTNSDELPYSLGGGRQIEAILPAAVMQRYQVVIDYSHRTLTFAQPGTLKPAGILVPFRINASTGIIAVDISIDGKTYAIAVDSGSAYTWVRKSTAQKWLDVHPEWQQGVGAVGASNMRMADDGLEADGTVVRIPEARLESLRLRQIGALAIGSNTTKEDFMDWYSKKNPVPVIGWLGGNVLRGFRLTIDYPNRRMYWLRQTKLDPHDLDQVGLTLMSKKHEYVVAAIATQNRRRTVDGVHVGDKLLQIDKLQTNTASWSEIFSALHGRPGERRTLLVERDGRQFDVQARVTAF